MRVALYARYSTGNQSPLSCEDQLRMCRELAAKLGWVVVAVFFDPEISGFDGARPEFNRLLDFARAGQCDAVICEHSNRMARDGEKGWHVFNLFKRIGVKYVTCLEGAMTVVGQSVSTMLSEIKGEETADFTRRGLRGVVEAGRSAGGLTYGYRKVRAYDAAGEPLRGLLEVDEAQAEVVRRIFRDYASGVSPQAIAHTLNREGVMGPRGGSWNASTIHGNAARGTGVIHNELYVGVRVWGRRTFVKDRATGMRSGRDAEAPPIRRDAPELRILPEDLWQAARARYALVSTGPMGEGVRGRRRPTRLLHGLVVCALCDRTMRRSGPGQAMRCSTRIEKGQCENSRAPGYPGIEARVVDVMRAELLHPEVIAHAVRKIQDGLKADRQGAAKRQAKASAEIGEIEARMVRLIDQMDHGGAPWSAIEGRHTALQSRLDQLKAEPQYQQSGAEPAADIVALGADAPAKYADLVARMSAALESPSDEIDRAAHEAFRTLIEEVRFTPADGHGKYALEIRGDLAPLFVMTPNAEGPLAGALNGTHLKRELGAGTRVTRRLRFSAAFTLAA